MKPINIFAAFLFFTLNQNIFAQEPDPLSFFPHSVGNIWEYDTPDGIQRYEIVGDSIAPDNSILVFFNRYPDYRIDTNFNVFMSPTGLNWHIYKLNSDSGDYWVYNKVEQAWWFAFISNVDTGLVFGEERILKQINYGFCRDTIFEPNYFFVVYYKIIVEGIGLIYEWNEEPPQGPQKILQGCIIDGDTFGVVTSVEEDLQIAEGFQLLQNYPNPFNPETTIKFQTSAYRFVELKVFNLLGQEISTIVNEEKPAGIYEVKFNGKDFSSGIYIYRLKTENKIISRKMILLK
ncbi:MAG: hypothetical protein A2057_03215 [Ignavibacteria bacterium GWA2_35_9]|nr:MAG: hypothetical protein A2057_03215 [Ignavibacteria bacterium GWA2_35_9]OGU50140.1 MAG: hypothetical protein A2080_14755 [Ignavibacteria bacterium GWC2_36_12]